MQPTKQASPLPPSYKKAAPIAARFGIHKKTLFRWADSGFIHKHKLGARLVVFNEAEVEQFVLGSGDR